MPRKEKMDMVHWHSKRLMSIGFLLIVAGVIYNWYPGRWDYVFLATGVLTLLKGIAIKFMKM